MTVALRPVEEADREFLFTLFVAARGEELAAGGWDASALDQLLRMQFKAQEHAYAGASSRSVVVLDGRLIGRLYVDERPGSLHVVDIALLPEWRGRGIGTALLRGVIESAAGRGRAVTLNVVRGSPALRLYERLGFAVVAENEVYLTLERQEKTAS